MSSPGPARPRNLALGYGLAVGSAAFYAIGGNFAKLVFLRGVAPATLAEFRVLFAFLFYLAAVALTRPADLRVRRSELPYLLVFGVLGLAGVQLAYFESIARLPIGVALVIEYTAPVMIFVVWRLRGRTVGGRLWIAGALTLTGSWFVVGAYDAALRELNALGAAIAFLDAVLLAVYLVTAERLVRRSSAWTVLLWGFGFATLAWQVRRPLWELPWTSQSGEVWLLILAVVVVATIVPYLLSVAAVAHIPAARLGLTSTSEPVIAAVAAWSILGERLELLQIGGGAVVLAGIVVAQSLRPTDGGV